MINEKTLAEYKTTFLKDYPHETKAPFMQICDTLSAALKVVRAAQNYVSNGGSRAELRRSLAPFSEESKDK